MAKAKKKNTGEETLNFGADVSRLLEIVAHALYANRDVFLRELVSNASDACDRLRYEAIENPDLIQDDPQLRVCVRQDAKARILSVADNGIGMDHDDLIDNLGTIAKSGTAALMEQLKGASTDKDKLSLIGQFGVGFYASFMVADKVTVVSRKAGEKDAWVWESDGRTGFTVREATDEEAARLIAERGTTIQLHINDAGSEYLLDQKLEQIIRTYSDHISFPVFLGEVEGDEEHKPVNSASALWARSKSEISDEDYKQFYNHISHGIDEPLITSHWKAEGKIEYTALLFTPTMRPWDLYDPTRKHAVRLYVKKVFITDDCEGLIYPWLRFVQGVIDSEDLSLNISRETLQHNPLIEKIKNGVAKRILSDLNKLADSDADKYAAFWHQFGSALKEGLYDAPAHREALFKVARFYSTHGDGLTSFAEYKERMKEGQKDIYYISGENLSTLRNSPQLEGFKSRGIEVLFFTDTIDDFWLQNVLDYEGHEFKSVTKGDIDLTSFENKDKDENDNQDDEKDESIEALRAKIKEILQDDIGEVRLSKRLTDSPVCLIAAADEVDLRMERVLRIHQKYEPHAKRTLEINPGHPLIKQMAALSDETALQDASYLLLDQARIIQGEPVPDPARFAKAMSQYLERGLGR